MAGARPAFLIESALLTHGLLSVPDDEILAKRPAGLDNIAYVDRGEVRITGIEEYLPFRVRAPELLRIDCDGLTDALEQKLSGALTASGTMAVCERMEIPLAVTAGMGGVGDIAGEEICPDLPALANIPVCLIATAPKDMLDVEATLHYLRERYVSIFGIGTDVTDGFMFRRPPAALDGVHRGGPPAAKTLLLNAIPNSERLTDDSMLEQAVQTGREAQARGEYFHPAVNAALDRLSGGKTSRRQLDSLFQNAQYAHKITQ